MVGDGGNAPPPRANQARALLFKLIPHEIGPAGRTCTSVARRQMVYSHLQLLLWHCWMKWSTGWESNPRRSAWKADILATELPMHGVPSFTTTSFKPTSQVGRNINWWTERELHPQKSPCKGGALLTMLSAQREEAPCRLDESVRRTAPDSSRHFFLVWRRLSELH